MPQQPQGSAGAFSYLSPSLSCALGPPEDYIARPRLPGPPRPQFLSTLNLVMLWTDPLPPSLTGFPNPSYDPARSKFSQLDIPCVCFVRLAGKPIDLQDLIATATQIFDGSANLTRTRQWGALAAELNLPEVAHAPGNPIPVPFADMLQQFYLAVLGPLEAWLKYSQSRNAGTSSDLPSDVVAHQGLGSNLWAGPSRPQFLAELADVMSRAHRPLPPALTGFGDPSFDPTESRFSDLDIPSKGFVRIVGVPVDLHELFLAVTYHFGGAAKITEVNQWGPLSIRLGLPGRLTYFGNPHVIGDILQQYYHALLGCLEHSYLDTAQQLGASKSSDLPTNGHNIFSWNPIAGPSRGEFLLALADLMVRFGRPLPPALTGFPTPSYDPAQSPFSKLDVPGEGFVLLAGLPVDLHALYVTVVHRFGGAAKITRAKKWGVLLAQFHLPEMAFVPGNPNPTSTAAILDHYYGVLLGRLEGLYLGYQHFKERASSGQPLESPPQEILSWDPVAGPGRRQFLIVWAHVMEGTGLPLPPALTGFPVPSYDPGASPFSQLDIPGVGFVVLARKCVDMHELFMHVAHRSGGAAKVAKANQWGMLSVLFGLPTMVSVHSNSTNPIPAAAMLEQFYHSLLHTIESWHLTFQHSYFGFKREAPADPDPIVVCKKEESWD